MLKIKLISFISCFLLLTGCSGNNNNENSGKKDTTGKNISEQASEIKQEKPISEKEPKAIKQWATQKKLKVPESVLYDQDNGIFYVSNINGKPLKKDNNGFISKMSKTGKIKQLKWIEGLNAPKGMAKTGNFLYVSDIDKVVKININKNKISKTYNASQAKFLNDVTIGKNGTVYISDMKKQTIYRLKNNTLKDWLTHDRLKKVNGLYFQNNYLLAGTNSEVIKIDPSNSKISSFIDNTGTIDGLQATGKQNQYLVSDWKGRVHWVHPKKAKVKLIDTRDQNINAADIEFVPAPSLLLVPTFSDNRVVAYKVKGL